MASLWQKLLIAKAGQSIQGAVDKRGGWKNLLTSFSKKTPQVAQSALTFTSAPPELKVFDVIDTPPEQLMSLLEEDRAIFGKCLETVMSEGKASTSLLQRRQKVGYARAASYLEIMTKAGIVSSADGTKAPEILAKDLVDAKTLLQHYETFVKSEAAKPPVTTFVRPAAVKQDPLDITVIHSGKIRQFSVAGNKTLHPVLEGEDLAAAIKKTFDGRDIGSVTFDYLTGSADYITDPAKAEPIHDLGLGVRQIYIGKEEELEGIKELKFRLKLDVPPQQNIPSAEQVGKFSLIIINPDQRQAEPVNIFLTQVKLNNVLNEDGKLSSTPATIAVANMAKVAFEKQVAAMRANQPAPIIPAPKIEPITQAPAPFVFQEAAPLVASTVFTAPPASNTVTTFTAAPSPAPLTFIAAPPKQRIDPAKPAANVPMAVRAYPDREESALQSPPKSRWSWSSPLVGFLLLTTTIGGFVTGLLANKRPDSAAAKPDIVATADPRVFVQKSTGEALVPVGYTNVTSKLDWQNMTAPERAVANKIFALEIAKQKEAKEAAAKAQNTTQESHAGRQ